MRQALFYTILRTIILAALITTVVIMLQGCSHVPHTPPSFGYTSVINPGKPVFCVDYPGDELGQAGLSGAQCDAVHESINEINKAVGFELLHFAGWMPLSPDAVPAATVDIIIVAQAPLPENVIGLTGIRAYDGHVALGTVILLDQFIWTHTKPSGVILHELIHALGGGHAASRKTEGNTYYTVEAPSYDPESVHLQPTDIAALRAVYR